MQILVTHTYRDKGVFTKVSLIRRDDGKYEVEQLFIQRDKTKNPQMIRYPHGTLEEVFKNWPNEFSFEELA